MEETLLNYYFSDTGINPDTYIDPHISQTSNTNVLNSIIFIYFSVIMFISCCLLSKHFCFYSFAKMSACYDYNDYNYNYDAEVSESDTDTDTNSDSESDSDNNLSYLQKKLVLKLVEPLIDALEINLYSDIQNMQKEHNKLVYKVSDELKITHKKMYKLKKNTENLLKNYIRKYIENELLKINESMKFYENEINKLRRDLTNIESDYYCGEQQ